MLLTVFAQNKILFLSLSVFFLGFLVGLLNRPILCVHNVDNDSFVKRPISQSQSHIDDCKKPLSHISETYCGIADTVDNSQTFVHTNYFNKIQRSVLSTVFGMLHHPSCPVTAELILTQSDDWKDDYSLCDSVYAVRSPVRDDHPNKCYAVMRASPVYLSGVRSSSNNTLPLQVVAKPYATNGICHRTGSIEWPQILSDQYQVCFPVPYHRHTNFIFSL